MVLKIYLCFIRELQNLMYWQVRYSCEHTEDADVWCLQFVDDMSLKIKNEQLKITNQAFCAHSSMVLISWWQKYDYQSIKNRFSTTKMTVYNCTALCYYCSNLVGILDQSNTMTLLKTFSILTPGHQNLRPLTKQVHITWNLCQTT